MARFHPAWLEHRRRRFTRPDGHRWIRPDGQRYLKPKPYKRTDSPPPDDAGPDLAAEIKALLRLKSELAALKAELKFGRLLHARKYSPDQPRVPAGNPDGGQWTSGSGTAQSANDTQEENRLEQSLTTAPDQRPRGDLSQLQAITNDPVIRPQIERAWNASNPNSMFPQEHGFWIAKDSTTGELLSRPFANPGVGNSMRPGPMPSDAVAFFHTHPFGPTVGGVPGPSSQDEAFARNIGLPGIIRSHNGMYYFGPSLRP